MNWRASPLHAAVVGLANAIMQAVSAFGVHMSDSQNAAVTAVVNATLIVFSVLFIQSTDPKP